MLSAFYPTGARDGCDSIAVPYMTPESAALYDATYASLGLPNGTFSSIKMDLCKPSTTHGGTYPLVLFSPGMSESCQTYSFIAASLASEGYVVVTVDHPYDASII